MSENWKEVVRLKFRGERFRDHALDLSALTELRQFQRIVAETAKALWRTANPDRDRLPPHFEERTRLCLRRIEEGSAVAPLEVYLEPQEQQELWQPEPEELNEAIDLAYETFVAVAEERELPVPMPKHLVSELSEFGKSLDEDEEIEIDPLKNRRPVGINRVTRERLTAHAERPHSSIAELTGECLEADVRNRHFQLWTDPHTSVEVRFDEAQESLVTSALKDHRAVRVKVRGTAEFSAQGKPLRFSAIESLELIGVEGADFDANAPAIEDELADIWANVPESEWAKLPPDLSERLDQYIYGTPK